MRVSSGEDPIPQTAGFWFVLRTGELTCAMGRRFASHGMSSSRSGSCSSRLRVSVRFAVSPRLPARPTGDWLEQIARAVEANSLLMTPWRVSSRRFCTGKVQWRSFRGRGSSRRRSRRSGQRDDPGPAPVRARVAGPGRRDMRPRRVARLGTRNSGDPTKLEGWAWTGATGSGRAT